MTVRIIALAVLIALGARIWLIQEQRPASGPETGPLTERSLLADPDAVGVAPDGPPQLTVEHELAYEGPRAVLHFTVTERNGWYVDHIFLKFWYAEPDASGQLHQIGDPVMYLCKGYLGFNETLTDSTTITEVEFSELDDFGTTDNWQVAVSQYGRVLAPEP
jgi:hypothetical protein